MRVEDWQPLSFWVAVAAILLAIPEVSFLRPEWVPWARRLGWLVLVVSVLAGVIAQFKPALPWFGRVALIFVRLPAIIYKWLCWQLLKPVLAYGGVYPPRQDGTKVPSAVTADDPALKTEVPWIFEDNFDGDLDKHWETFCGQPRLKKDIDVDSLFLPNYNGSPFHMNSCVRLKTRATPKRGLIECKIYLCKDAILNIVFRGDLKNKKAWYMARLDARDARHDGILRKLPGDSGWDFIGTHSSHVTIAGGWHHMRLELNDTRMFLFNDGEEVAQVDDASYKGGEIAIFNEVNNAYVAKLRIYDHDARNLGG